MTMDYRTKWARFEASSMREKLAIFKRLYGCSGEHLNAVLLGELVKVRLQEIQFGELTPAEEARLEAVCSLRDYPPPHRGEILRRTYRGRLYEVSGWRTAAFAMARRSTEASRRWLVRLRAVRPTAFAFSTSLQQRSKRDE